MAHRIRMGLPHQDHFDFGHPAYDLLQRGWVTVAGEDLVMLSVFDLLRHLFGVYLLR
jgi:hypothetical protein